ASGEACDGAYTGVFNGHVFVSSGQNCMFIGGGVNGEIIVTGGALALFRAKVTGNVRIIGGGEFSIRGGSEINGFLRMDNVSSEVSSNALCGSTVKDNLVVFGNSIPIQIGSMQASCPGNSIGQWLVIRGNTGPIGVYKNQVAKTMTCDSNLSIAGHSNSAEVLGGQCI